MSEVLTRDRRATIGAEVDRRIAVSMDAEDTEAATRWRFVRGIVDDYEATVEAVERLAVLVRRDVAELQTKLGEQAEVLERATRCRLCDGKGEYFVPTSEPGSMEKRVCLLCDYNGRRIDELHAFLVFAVGSKDRVVVPQDSIEVVEEIHVRAVQLMADPVYNLRDIARGGGETED